MESIRVIAVAHANDAVACAEGKLSEVGAPPSGGSPSSSGRGRRTTSFTAKLSPIANGPSAPATSHSSRRSPSMIAIAIPIASQIQPYSPRRARNLAAASRRGPCQRVLIAYSSRLSSA